MKPTVFVNVKYDMTIARDEIFGPVLCVNLERASPRLADSGWAPWGGFKYSGIGREYSGYGIEWFLETKANLE